MDFQHALHLYDSLYEGINGYTLSTRGRAEKGLYSKLFTYGEVSPEAFYAILKSLPRAPKGIFYDLGSGTGKPVFLAHLLFDFTKTIGIELLDPLYETAHSLLLKYKYELQSWTYPHKSSDSIIFFHEDFLHHDFSDADVVFTHSTCFPDDIWIQLTAKFELMKQNAYVITVTKTISSNFFELIKTKEYGMAWGRATVYIYKKV